MSVIAGVIETAEEGSASPFQGQAPPSGPGPPRMPGG
jgi:hypothetical protein